MSDDLETEIEQPAAEHATRREFEAGSEDDFDEFQNLVNAWMERLGNDVERPCEMRVKIEVFDRD